MREQKVSTRSLKIRDTDDRLEVPILVGKWTDRSKYRAELLAGWSRGTFPL